jgi:hypothetical protein
VAGRAQESGGGEAAVGSVGGAGRGVGAGAGGAVERLEPAGRQSGVDVGAREDQAAGAVRELEGVLFFVLVVFGCFWVCERRRAAAIERRRCARARACCAAAAAAACLAARRLPEVIFSDAPE